MEVMGGAAVVLVVNGRLCLSELKAVNVEEKSEEKLTGVVLPSVVLVAFLRCNCDAAMVLVIAAADAPGVGVVVVVALGADLTGAVVVGVAFLRLGILVVRLVAMVVAFTTVARVAGTAEILKLRRLPSTPFGDPPSCGESMICILSPAFTVGCGRAVVLVVVLLGNS